MWGHLAPIASCWESVGSCNRHPRGAVRELCRACRLAAWTLEANRLCCVAALFGGAAFARWRIGGAAGRALGRHLAGKER